MSINEITLCVYHGSIRNAQALCVCVCVCVCNVSQSIQFSILFPLPESLVRMSVPLYIM